MKEYKKVFNCKICNMRVEVLEKNMYTVFQENWKEAHQACEDMKHIYFTSVKLRGGESAYEQIN